MSIHGRANMAKAHKDRFIPQNPHKYIASNIDKIMYRSSWEQSMMMVLDNHPNVIGWASEAVKVPYFNPFSKRSNRFGNQTVYIPDFFIYYVDQNGVEHKDLIEIKPADEMPGYKGKVSKLKEARQALNLIKWRAAMIFCAARDWRFRVAGEKELFAFKRQNT
jgi:hypothetical protein